VETAVNFCPANLGARAILPVEIGVELSVYSLVLRGIWRGNFHIGRRTDDVYFLMNRQISRDINLEQLELLGVRLYALFA